MVDFGPPRRGGDAERTSLFLQSKSIKADAIIPSDAEISVAEDALLELYPRTKIPPYFRGDEHSVTYAHIDSAIDEINKASSPGLPFAEDFKTKGDALMPENRQAIYDEVMSRLDLLQCNDVLPTSPRELVEQGFTDPVRLFVKNEPHKKSKISEGRFRLIASVSVIDEIVERLICTNQNKREIQLWKTIPSKPGMGMSLADQTHAVVQSIPSDDGAEADISGWDWSIPWWCFQAEARIRARLAGAAPDSLFARMLRNRFWCLTRSVFATSDGKMYEQLVPGVMKSGSYLTSSSNSRIRILLTRLVGSSWAIAMGDDSVEEFVEGAARKYAAMGFKVKMYAKCTRSNFNFCSHHFVNGIAKYANVGKASYNLYMHAPSEEQAMAYLETIRYSDEFERLFGVLAQVWSVLGNNFYENAIKQIEAKVQEERSWRLYEEEKSHRSTSA